MRWRPPPEKSSPYITQVGFQRLKRELAGLWVQRREVVAALSAAAAEGDRSENAEYIYRKKQLREMDRRIRYLSKRLDVLKPVDRPPGDPGRVYFGARVEVEAEDGSLSRYHIVGADEIGSTAEAISVDSPVARKLLGKGLDDEVCIDTPGGTRVLTIAAIDYERAD